MVEAGAALLEEPVDRRAAPAGTTSSRASSCPNRPTATPLGMGFTWLTETPSSVGERKLCTVGCDADVIELCGAENGVVHVTVDGRW